VVRRRSRLLLTPADAEPSPPAQPAPAKAPAAKPRDPRGYVCPSCRQGFAEPGRCPKDDTPLIPYAEFSRAAPTATRSRRCPSCGTEYPGDTAFCGKDGTRLDV
jgi:hypothetical protein